METNKSVTVQVETVGQAYLEILRARGIKYFFGNSGTDFGPMISESKARGGTAVVVIGLCLISGGIYNDRKG